MTEPLDLYAPTLRELRRPRLAALGCWCLSVNACLALISLGISWIPYWLLGPSSDRLLPVHLVLQGLLILTGLAGMLLTGFANVAGTAINPWPRRLAMVLAVIAPFIVIPYHVMALKFRTGATSPLTDFIRLYYVLLLLSQGCQAAIHIVSLIYLLQLAAWRRSRSLAVASSILFTVAIFSGALSFVMMADLAALYFFDIGRLPEPWFMSAYRALSGILGTIVALGFSVFFTTLALRLRRAADRQSFA